MNIELHIERLVVDAYAFEGRTDDLQAVIATELGRRMAGDGAPSLLRSAGALASLRGELPAGGPATLGTRIGAALHGALSPALGTGVRR